MDKLTEFIKWYLRFNGYFSIESFVVHDAGQTKEGAKIRQQTECDLLCIRLPYSQEYSANLCMANDPQIVVGAENKIDAIICEVKSGKDNAPNPVWVHASTNMDMIEYIVRFCGVLPENDEFTKACKELSRTYKYVGGNSRIRYLIFSKEINKRHQKRGVTYLTIQSVIEFLISVRGHSWRGAKLGVASQHQQWPDFVNKIFDIANYSEKTVEEQVSDVCNILEISN